MSVLKDARLTIEPVNFDLQIGVIAIFPDGRKTAFKVWIKDDYNAAVIAALDAIAKWRTEQCKT